MKRPGDLVILLETRTAPKNFWQPKLSHSTLHMANLALGWGRSLNPLGGFPSDTAYHISMGQGLRCPLLRLDI